MADENKPVIYQTSNVDLHRDLGRLEGKIDGIQSSIIAMGIENRNLRDTITAVDNKIDLKHDEVQGRITRVQNRQYWMSGAAAGLGAVFGALFQKVGSFLFGGPPLPPGT